MSVDEDPAARPAWPGRPGPGRPAPAVAVAADPTVAALTVAVAARVPVLLWGAPGTGKTSVIRAMAGALGWPCETVIASIREPSDFAGLPVVVGDGVRFAPPAWARRLAEAGRGLLFLDELSTAPPAVQAALLRVVLERVVGDLELPPEVAVVAAANPPRAGGRRLGPVRAAGQPALPPLVGDRPPGGGRRAGRRLGRPPGPAAAGRLGRRARPGPGAGGRVPARPARPGLRPAVGRRRGRDAAGRARGRGRWPPGSGPRAGAAGVRRGGAGRPGPRRGGRRRRGEFLAWVAEMDLPDPEEVLADPAGFLLPARGDRAYAAVAAVAAVVAANPHPATLGRRAGRCWASGRGHRPGRRRGGRPDRWPGAGPTVPRRHRSSSCSRRSCGTRGCCANDRRARRPRPGAGRGAALGGRPVPLPGQRHLRHAGARHAGQRNGGRRRGLAAARRPGASPRPGRRPSWAACWSTTSATCCGRTGTGPGPWASAPDDAGAWTRAPTRRSTTTWSRQAWNCPAALCCPAPGRRAGGLPRAVFRGRARGTGPGWEIGLRQRS